MGPSKFDGGVVLERFALTEVICAGSTIAYEAVDNTNGGKVVVKIGSPDDEREDAGAAVVQMNTEFNLLTGPLLGCPGVPVVLGFGETTYTLEGIPQRLPVIVESPLGRSFPGDNETPLTLQACGASIYRTLREIHQRGVIHRDIKPSNIIIADDGSPILIDFGISCTYDDPTRPIVCGTRSYISSRIFGGYPADMSTDIDSLLCAMHSLEVGSEQWTALKHPADRLPFPPGGVAAQLRHNIMADLAAHPHPRVPLSYTTSTAKPSASPTISAAAAVAACGVACLAAFLVNKL